MKILFFFLLLSQALASEDSRWAGNVVMNGLKFSTYSESSRNWSLVTVRYRQDTGEFRFTYANQKAYEALIKNSPYPDGAAFTKTAYRLGADSSFPSSLSPQKVARYQVMLRDSRNKKTDGWTYALFDAQGKTFPGEPQAAAQACHSCHEIVAEKRYVFSEPLPNGVAPLPALNKNLPKFMKIKTADLPAHIRKLIPEGISEIYNLEGKLQVHMFEGTVNEIIPFLSQQTILAKAPTLLMSKDARMFSLVMLDPKNGNCEKSPLGQTHALLWFVGLPEFNANAPYAQHGHMVDGIASSAFCFSESSGN